MNKFYKAMTFAEMLLVVGIIGVVAMLSLPSMKKHSQMAEMGRLAQAAYLAVDGAVENATLVSGSMKSWKLDDNQYFCQNYLAPNLKTIEVSCNSKADNASYVVLPNGIKMTVAECHGPYCHVHVDVNGPKLPNKYGKDFFEFAVVKAEQKVRPHCPVERWLRANNWTFSKEVWNCSASCSSMCGIPVP